jgi:hypothetical protein
MKLEVPIEIKSSVITQKTVRGKRDGKEYLIRTQTAWADLGKDYPQEIEVPISDGQQPYPEGKFHVDPASLRVDRYNQLSIGRLKLIAAK